MSYNILQFDHWNRKGRPKHQNVKQHHLVLFVKSCICYYTHFTCVITLILHVLFCHFTSCISTQQSLMVEKKEHRLAD